MFYCKRCGDKRKWPTDWWLPQSHGPCEVCGKTATCYDVPSKNLPEPQR